MTRRGKVIGAALGAAIGITLIVAATAWWVVRRRVDRALAAAAEAASAADQVTVSWGTPTPLDQPSPGLVLTSTRQARDGVAAFGQTWVATDGGVLVYDSGGDAEGHLARTLTPAQGLASADCTALALLGDEVVIGSGQGGLTLVSSARATPVTFAGAASGAAVSDLAVVDGRLYVAALEGGLLAWDGHEPTARRVTSGAVAIDGATTLAAGTAGVAVGTLVHGVYLERAGENDFQPVALPDVLAGARITALAFNGDELLIGTPLALASVDLDHPGGGAQAARIVRPDVFVSSLLVEPTGRVDVATFDGGALLMDRGQLGAAQAHVVLPSHRLTRVRMVDGQAMAFGLDGAWRLPANGSTSPVAMDMGGRALAGATVTAITARGDEVWVGTFENGVDVFDRNGKHLRHPTLVAPAAGDASVSVSHGDPASSEADGPKGADGPDGPDGSDVNAIAWRPTDDALLIATVHGVFTLDGAGGVHHQGSAEGLMGDQVAALALAPTGNRVAYATNRGLSIAGADGALRGLYALQGLANNHCDAVAWGADGRLYVGTLGGLSVVGPNLSVQRSWIAGHDGLPVAWVTALASDSEAMIAGTYGGGVVSIAADGTVDGLASPHAHVNPGALVVAGDWIYAGTLEDGLLAYSRVTRTWSRLPQGLASHDVTALAPVGDRLWLGTDQGLLILSDDDVTAALEPIE
jgi:hypothetical protein